MLTAADTAFSVAFVRAQESMRPAAERLFEDPFAALFTTAGGHASAGTERFLALPAFVDAVRLRTRFIDDFVREGSQSGIEQVVLLGAGFDMRALRIPEIGAHAISVYEVDFGEQLQWKRRLLETAGVQLPAWIRYVACDFHASRFDEELAEHLAGAGFRDGARTLFVWEGVIAYIGADAIRRMLGFMVNVGGSGTRVVFDFAPMAFDPDPASERVKRAGFTRFEQVGYDEIWRRYLPGDPHPNVSVVCMGIASV